MVDNFDSRCEDSPTKAHHYIKLVGSIWRCRYCWAPRWLPMDLEEAIQFSNSIERLGLEVAYNKHIYHKPKVRELLAKLEDIRLLRRALPEDQLSFATAAMITDKEYELEDIPLPDFIPEEGPDLSLDTLAGKFL